MDILSLIKWLDTTPGSLFIRESLLFYPIIETTHVLALCLFLGLIAIVDLRLVGIGFRGVPVSEVASKILPIALFGFVLMSISGVLLFYSGPLKAYNNIFFRIKMVGIVLTGINAAIYHLTIEKRIVSWDSDPIPPPRARLAGVCSLLLWSAVVICGRMQAYNWFN